MGEFYTCWDWVYKGGAVKSAANLQAMIIAKIHLALCLRDLKAL